MSDTFKVLMSTPIGKLEGSITFINNDGSLSGYIKSMGNISYFENGTMTGNQFEFSGTLNAAFLQFKYRVNGTIDGDTFAAVASTGSGTFKINGTREDT